MTSQIRGVFCAAATPITEDGAPDLIRAVAHAKQLITDGCDGVALLGQPASEFILTAPALHLARGIAGNTNSGNSRAVELTRHALLGQQIRHAAAILLQAAKR
jgi:4-hydroxy-tetrahydrodipicolinate synthase